RVLVGEGRSVSIESPDVLTHVGLADPERLQRSRARRTRCAQDAQQEVLRPDVGTAEPACLLLGERDDRSRLRGEALEHRYLLRARRRPLACFLCTAWRLTPSSSAISLHHHPSPRAPPPPPGAACLPPRGPLEPLHQLAERGHGSEPDPRILVSGGPRELRGLAHDCHFTLTSAPCQPCFAT